MKRAILICFVIAMIMFYVGCTLSSEDEKDLVEDHGSETDIMNDHDAETNQGNKLDDIEANGISDYEIYEEEYTVYKDDKSSFNVKYAQVSGLEDVSLTNKINQALKTSTTEWINQYCEWAKRFQLESQLRSPDYLSLFYIVEFESPSPDDYNVDYVKIGITIDMHTGERVYLDNIIEDMDSLKQDLENYYGSSSSIDEKEADEIIRYSSMSEKEYIEELYKSDPHVHKFINSYLRVKPTFYLTDDKLVIIRGESLISAVYLDFKY